MCVSVCCRRDELLFREVFWLSLRTKRDRKKTREKEWEGERENVFATACLLAFGSRRRLVERERKKEERGRALAPRPVGYRSTDQHSDIEIE
jgi:hypothetical protein